MVGHLGHDIRSYRTLRALIPVQLIVCKVLWFSENISGRHCCHPAISPSCSYIKRRRKRTSKRPDIELPAVLRNRSFLFPLEHLHRWPHATNCPCWRRILSKVRHFSLAMRLAGERRAPDRQSPTLFSPRKNHHFNWSYIETQLPANAAWWHLELSTINNILK